MIVGTHHILSFLCCLLSIAHAYENHVRLSRFIKEGNKRKIQHGIEGLKYAATVSIMGCIGLLLGVSWYEWVLPAFLARLFLFDPVFSLLRGKGIFYNGDGDKDAIQDNLENTLPNKWVIALKISYAAFFIAFQAISPVQVDKIYIAISTIFN